MSDNLIKPYGDTLNDGVVQLSFTLPIEASARARKAAEAYVAKLNFEEISVAHYKKIADGFTYFVVYARAIPVLDYNHIQAQEVESKGMDYYEINKQIAEKFGRKLNVVGATIGTDAHTVGIDAIMNMKGWDGNYGLERYSEMNAYNMGAQIPSETLLAKAIEVKADAILVSQTVTQKDSHIRNFTEFMELVEAENLRKNFILLIGGPRITNEMAIEMGYDAGFGPGTKPSNVAEYILTRLMEKQGLSR